MALLRKTLRAYAKYKKYRRILNELNSLNDKELADIGISRGDIERVAWM